MADDAVPVPAQAPPVTAPPPPEQPAAPDVQSLLGALHAHYPNCFPAQGADPKPLKIGIHLDLVERGGLPDGVTDKALRRFFRWYTTRFRYRKVLAKGGRRVDLDDHPCGDVTEEQAMSAKANLTPKEKASTTPPAQRPSAPTANPLSLDAPLTENNVMPGKLEVIPI